MESSRGAHHLVPYFLFFLEVTDKMSRPAGFCCWENKDPQLWRNAAVSKEKLVDHVNKIAAYTITHDCSQVLGWRTTSLSVLERVIFICQEAKSNASWHLETMGEFVNPTLYAPVVVEGIAVKVAKFRDVLL